MGAACSVLLLRSNKTSPGTEADRRVSTSRPENDPNFRGTVDRSASFDRSGLQPLSISDSGPTLRNPMSSGIEYTPIGDEKDVFKFYCPLCMLYFKDMYVTGCCKNSICYTCLLGYCRGSKNLQCMQYTARHR